MGSEDPWPPKSTRSRLLRPVVQMLAALPMVWGGVRTVALGSAPMGILLFVFGGITAALAGRQLIRRVRSLDSGFESSGELSKEEFDYLVWIALGLPVVIVLAVLVIVLTGLC
jgi:uncharacterized membrane protein YidH (DUF202 family)